MMMRCKALLLCVWAAAFIGLFPPGAAHGEEKTLDSMPSLVSDLRAHGVGQNVTVLIYEQAQSSTSAGTTTTKSMDVSGQIKTTDDLNLGGVSLENNAKGEGSINRTGSLMASVSATVTEVLPTGELDIRGEQRIEFNNEIQFIKVSGHIRPEDIRADNTVLSSRIADAQITYVGDGLLGSRQKPGWITRFFNWLF